MPASCRETDLYPPLKAFLQGQGYEVKSEITGADIVGLRGAEPPVIIEMKTGFSLTLFHQAIDRLALSDHVYLAVPRGSGRRFQSALKENVKLARRLGLGLLLVRLSDGHVEPVCDPGPYAPRPAKKRQARLLREFARREGDPNSGGHRGKIITAYRQDCDKIAAYLAQSGPQKGAQVAQATGIAAATRIMAADHYGWFERVSRGVYQLTPKGRAALLGADQESPQT
ncbi:MAG: DUF2161 domain-containing phosphodiesterase [Mangrovicoccus sp.]